MGIAHIEHEGTKVAALLTVFRGYGRVMSVLSVFGGGCQEQIEEFLPKLELSESPPGK